jgi:putative protease
VPEGVRLAWHPEDYREEALEKGLCGMPEGIWLQLPEVCEEDTLQMLRAFAHRHADRLGGVILGSVGQLGASWELPFGAGTGVPVMNRRAAALLFGAGCRFVTASLELTGEEMKRLAEGCGKILLPAYGRTQLMLLHHCPARVLLGLREGHADCRMCDLHSPDALEGTELVDMHGAAYPLLRERLREGCLIRLMESSPVNNVLKAKAFGCPVLMELTDETDASSVSVPGRNSGHWNKPVE